MRTQTPLYWALGAAITMTATIGGNILVNRGSPGQAGLCLVTIALIGATAGTFEIRYRHASRRYTRLDARITTMDHRLAEQYRDLDRTLSFVLREVRQLKLGVAKGHELEHQSIGILETIAEQTADGDGTGPHPIVAPKPLRRIQ